MCHPEDNFSHHDTLARLQYNLPRVSYLLLSPYSMEQQSSSSSALKPILGILVVVLLAFVLVLDGRRREAEQRLKQVSVRLEQVQGKNEAQNKELAKQVLVKMRKHIVLPADPEPTVATIVDVEKLRERNVFYQKAENGYHLVLTADRAILYDAKRDIIVDVAPIQLQPVQSSSEVPVK